MDFAWHKDGTWSYKHQAKIPGCLTGTDFDNQHKTVTRLDTNKAYKTLGVFLAPDGSMKAEFKELMKKAQKWADKLRIAPFCEQKQQLP